MIWKQACIGMQELTDILQSGYMYQEKDGKLCPVMTSALFAAPELSNDIVCECERDQCYTEECCCIVSDQPCTAACGYEASTDASHGGECGIPLTYMHIHEDDD